MTDLDCRIKGAIVSNVLLLGIVLYTISGKAFAYYARRTGMKCLPQSKISQAQGVVLHDWHAETVAIRSFNQFLLGECQSLAQSGEQKSDYLRRRIPAEITASHFQPFTLNEDVILHMYCSEAPCTWPSIAFVIDQPLIHPSQAATQVWSSP
jgi:tRNA-specific adenosine deaminase 1